MTCVSDKKSFPDQKAMNILENKGYMDMPILSRVTSD